MTVRHWWVALMMLAAIAAPSGSQQTAGADPDSPYDLLPNWLKPVEEGWLMHPVAVFAETPDRVFIGLTGVTPRASAPPGLTTFNPKVPGARVHHQLFVVNRNGTVVEEWTQWSELFGSLHDISISPYDPDKHVWVVDRASQQVLKFSHDGKKLVMAIGEKGVAGNDDTHFGRPTDIAWLPDGTFFVSDGYDNRRVVKFDRNGRFLTAWGSQGTGPGQFMEQVHGIAVDAKRRVYVADRAAGRVQIFDENGKFLAAWPGMKSPTRVWITQDQYAWVSDSGAQRLFKYDLNGKLVTYFNQAGDRQGGLATAHDFSVDSEGSLYISTGSQHRVDKYVPRRNADRSRLVGPGYVASGSATR
jgi:DNA-binding beta-propeller fold protein YncE